MNTITIETKLDRNFLEREDLKEFLGNKVQIVMMDLESRTSWKKASIEREANEKLEQDLDKPNTADLH